MSLTDPDCPDCGEPRCELCHPPSEAAPATLRTPEVTSDDQMLRDIPRLAREAGASVWFVGEVLGSPMRWTVMIAIRGRSELGTDPTLHAAWLAALARFPDNYETTEEA